MAAVAAVLAVTAVPFPAGATLAATPVPRDSMSLADHPDLRLDAPLRARLGSSVIDPSAVVQLSDPGVELTAPRDGRLRGDEIALVVTGAALTDRAGTGGEAVSAGAGQHLIVFGFRQVPQPADPDAPPASLALVVAGQRRSIDLAALSGDGPWYFAAAVPAGASDVALELSAAGFSQDFSLMTLTRVGPAPAVLYRDPDKPEVVDTDSSTVAVAVAAGPPASTTYSLQVGAATTTIGWFAPDASGDTPSSPDQAFLAVQLQTAPLIDAANNDVVEVLWPNPVPADHVQLVLPDGTRIGATHVDAAPDLPGVSVNLLAGVYYFAVPADIAAATLSVGAYRAAGQAGELLPADTTITMSAFTVPLDVSPPPAVPAATTAPTVLTLTNAGATAAGRGAGSPSSFPTTGAAGGLIFLVAAAGVVWFGVHRRRRRATVVATGLQPGWMRPPAATASPSSRGAATTVAPPAEQAPVVGPSAGTAASVAAPTSAPASPRMPTASPAPPPAAPTLVAVPAGPADPPAGVLYFEVLGPLHITGWPDDQPRSLPVVDLAAYLALHPGRPYTAEELRDPLSIGKARALEAGSIRTYASTLRRNVGVEHLPDGGRKGYALAGSDSDWHRFVALSADRSDGVDVREQAESLAEALALVRGLPFSELPAGFFGWVATELLISDAEVAVIAAAARLVDLALDAGDWTLAAWASDQGLKVSPTSQVLNAGAIRAAHRSAQPDRVGQVWRDVARRYRAAGEAVPDDLARLDQELRGRGVPVSSNGRTRGGTPTVR